jgi:alkaline ceramidase
LTKSAFYGCKKPISLNVFIDLIFLSPKICCRYCSTMIFFCPRRYLPQIIKKKVNFTACMIFFCVAATILSVWNPVVNAFALMCLALPTFFLLYKELQRVKHKDPRVYELGIRTIVVLSSAIVIWINDRLFCSFYTSVRVTYLHAIWHVLIFL